MEKAEAIARYEENRNWLSYLQQKRKEHLLKVNNLITKVIEESESGKLFVDFDFAEAELELKLANEAHNQIPIVIRQVNEYAKKSGKPELKN